jgi:electron transfer flavoprotein alpha subunit
MENILFLAHSETDGALAKAALEALTAAKSLGGALTAGVVGSVALPVAERTLAVCGPEFSAPRYASDAAAAELLIRTSGASLVIAACTSRWVRVLPGVAHRLGGRADTHVTQIKPADGKIAIRRWFYRQRMEAELERSQRPWIILVEPGCYEPFAGSLNGVMEPLTPPAVEARTRVEGVQAPRADEQTIRPDAKLLFVAGAGWTKKQRDGKEHIEEAEKLILGFLNAAQASLGSSKSLVDLSGEGQKVLRFLTHLNQVGQTGATPRHPKGLATCCHGEEPHVVGWRFIRERRAVNLDPNCGWARGKADVVYVADAFEVMAKVNELLKAESSQRA